MKQRSLTSNEIMAPFAVYAMAFFLLTFLSGCSPQGTDLTGDTPRYFDRDIYFAVSDASTPGNELRNNPAHQTIIKDAMIEMAKNTSLGEAYFRFHEVDETFLTMVTEESQGATDFKSFIMVLPGAVYQSFVLQNIGSGAPDPNAFLMVNAANKRQFYIAFNADCFQGTSSCNGVSVNGMNALVARQFGYFLGFSNVDCATKPNNIMCNDPADTQWSFRNSFFIDIDNMLNTISEDPNFYK